MESEELKVATEAAKELGLKELVPTVYQDLLQPAVRETGQNLVVVAKAVGVALAPLEGLVWGYDQTKAFVSAKVSARLANRSPQEIKPPDKTIAGPLLMNLAFASDAPHLKEMYANLLASSMHTPTASRVHPSFVQVIQQLTPAEARILRCIASKAPASEPLFTETLASLMAADDEHTSILVRRLFAHREQKGDIANEWNRLCQQCGVEEITLAQTFLTNLIRLGILAETVIRVKNPRNLSHIMSTPENENSGVLKRELSLTEYGNLFLDLCVREETAVLEPKDAR